MKKIIYTLIALTSLAGRPNAQTVENLSQTFSSKDLAADLVKRGKQQKKNSMILFGAGVVSFATAQILQKENKSIKLNYRGESKHSSSKKSSFISVLRIAGVSMSAVSIPMFFSGKSKIKNSRLMFGIEKVEVPILENSEKLISFGIVTTIY